MLAACEESCLGGATSADNERHAPVVTAGRLLAGRSVVCLPAVRRWRGSWWGELLAVFTTEFLGGRRAVCWSLNVVADVS
jgi:hypothetical protein